MTFDRPERLWLLLVLGAFLLSLAWRRRSPLFVVPALRIWEEALRSQRPHLRTRVQDLLSTLLAVLAFAALVGAAARPVSRGERESPLDLVLAIDNSPSLAARAVPGGPTRHERAAEAAIALVRGLGPLDRWALVVPGPAGVVASPLHPAAEPLAPETVILRASEPRLAPVDLDGAVRVARLVASRSPRARVVVVTDGVGQGERYVKARLPDAIVIDVGGPSDNRGFVSLESESLADGRVRVSVEVANPGGADLDATVAWETLRGRSGRRSLPLKRGAVTSTTVEEAVEPGDGLRIRIEPGDLFPIDDEVFVPAGPEPRRGAVVYCEADGGDPFLDAALAACHEILDPARIEYRPREPFAPPGADDVAIFDGCDGPPDGGFPAQAVLLFGSARPGLGLETAPAPDGDVAVLGFSHSHPVASGIPWDAFAVRGSRPLLSVREEETVARAAGGALVAAGERSGLRFVAFSFRASESDLRARPAAPLLVRNAVEWAVRSAAPDAAGLARTGSQIDLPAGEAARERRLSLRPLLARPGTGGTSIRVAPGRPADLGLTSPGLYLATWNGMTWRLGVNFLHRIETAHGRSDARFEPPTVASLRTTAPVRDDAAARFAAAGAVLLVASFLVNRRSGAGRARPRPRRSG